MNFFKPADFSKYAMTEMGSVPYGFCKAMADLCNEKITKDALPWFVTIEGAFVPYKNISAFRGSEHTHRAWLFDLERLNDCDHSDDKLILYVTVSKNEIKPHLSQPGALIMYNPAVAEWHCKCGTKLDMKKKPIV